MHSATPDTNRETLLSRLSSAVERSPVRFKHSAKIAVGTGSQTSPVWLLIDLTTTRPLIQKGTELPVDTDAALFIPASPGETLVAGDRGMLEAALQHFLGGTDLLSLRAGGAR